MGFFSSEKLKRGEGSTRSTPQSFSGPSFTALREITSSRRPSPPPRELPSDRKARRDSESSQIKFDLRQSYAARKARGTGRSSNKPLERDWKTGGWKTPEKLPQAPKEFDWSHFDSNINWKSTSLRKPFGALHISDPPQDPDTISPFQIQLPYRRKNDADTARGPYEDPRKRQKSDWERPHNLGKPNRCKQPGGCGGRCCRRRW